jgi:pimeloyl-ACP methyl ester carboxylesterase
MATFALIHGGGGSAWDWHLVSAELRERGHDPVAVDLPSEDASAGWWDYADAVVQAVGNRATAVVVGHSLGGFTAPLVCARVPADTLVLVAAMIPAPGELFEDWWANAGYEESGPGGESETRLRRRCASHGPSRRGRTRPPSISSAATIACSRPRGRAVTLASA